MFVNRTSGTISLSKYYTRGSFLPLACARLPIMSKSANKQRELFSGFAPTYTFTLHTADMEPDINNLPRWFHHPEQRNKLRSSDLMEVVSARRAKTFFGNGTEFSKCLQTPSRSVFPIADRHARAVAGLLGHPIVCQVRITKLRRLLPSLRRLRNRRKEREFLTLGDSRQHFKFLQYLYITYRHPSR